MNSRNVMFLLGIAIFVALVQNATAWNSWWNTNWKYRIPVKVTEESGNDLTGYQVNFTIDTAKLIQEGKIRSDCGDIRAVDSDDVTELPYWIEPGTCNTTHTVVWVKLDLLASSTKTIYVYYGNPNAVSESDGSSVFVYFNYNGNLDFDWYPYGGSSLLGNDPSAWQSVNGYIFANNTVANTHMHAIKNITMSNMRIHYKWNLGTLEEVEEAGFNFRFSDPGNRYFLRFIYYPTASRVQYELVKVIGGTATTIAAYAFTPTADTWYTVDILLNGSTVKVYHDGNLIIQATTLTDLTSGYFGLHQAYTAGTTKYFDDIYVANYVSPEPSVSVGTEEALNSKAAEHVEYPINASYYTAKLNATFTIEDDSIYTIAGGSVTKGLVAEWHFDEGSGAYAHDSTKNSNVGTIQNMYALKFDGVDDYVEVPDSPSFNFTATNQFSVCAWVYFHEDSSWDAITSQEDYNGWRFFVDDTYNKLNFGFKGIDGNYYQYGASFTYGSWQFVCGEYNGTHILVYRNGNLEAAYFVNVTPVDSSAPIIIGATYTGSVSTLRWFANGSIAEVRIYNRSLNSTEIQELYSEGPGADIVTDGLVLWHDYQKKTTLDYSGNGNDGTIYGNPQWVVDEPRHGWAAGKFGNALSFDGVDDYVKITNLLPEMGNTTTDFVNFTISLWVNIQELGKQHNLLRLQNSLNGTERIVPYITAGNQIALYVYGLPILHSGVYIDKDIWYYIVIEFTSQGRKIYVDGSLTSSDTNVLPYAVNNLIRIGSDIGGYYTNGLIDEVRIYNRALSDEEIKELYEMGLARYHVKVFLNGNEIYDNASYQNATEISIPLNITEAHPYNLTVWVNDTDENYPLVSARTILFDERSADIIGTEFQRSVYETTTQNFTVRFVFNPNLVNITNAVLNWNGTAISKTASTNNFTEMCDYSSVDETWNGTYVTCTHTYTIPLLSTTDDENVSVFFTVQYVNASGSFAVNSESTNQTVKNAFTLYILNPPSDYYPYLEKHTINVELGVDSEVSTPVLTFAMISFEGQNITCTRTQSNNYAYYYECGATPNVTNSLSENRQFDAVVDITFQNKTKTLTAARYYTVYRIIIAPCNSTISTSALTFHYLDESTGDSIYAEQEAIFHVKEYGGSFERTYSYVYDNSTEADYCINPSWAVYSVDADILYYNTSYTTRTYYLVNAAISNDTSNVNLYLVQNPKEVRITVVDNLQNPIENAIVKIDLFDWGNNKYITVASVRTDFEGKATTYLVLENRWYRFVVQTPDGLVYTFSPTQLSYDASLGYAPLTLKISNAENVFSSNLPYTCVFNSTNMILRCFLDDVSGLQGTLCLTLYRQGALQFEQEQQVCTQDTSSVLFLQVPNESAFYYYQFTYAQNNRLMVVASNYIDLLHRNKDVVQVILAVLLIAVMALLGLYAPSVAISMCVAALIISHALGLIVVSYSALVSIALVGAVIIHRVRS